MSIFPLKRPIVCMLCLLSIAFVGTAWAQYDNNSDETLRLVKAVYHSPDSAQLERLGDIYAQGEGVKKDLAEAITWYCYAIEQGSQTATDKLWKIENSMRAKPIKRVNEGKPYNDKATLELGRYLYVAGREPNLLLDKSLIPDGIKAPPSKVAGMVHPPEYSPAIVRKYIAKGANPNASPKVPDPKNPSSAGVNIRSAVIRQHDYKTFDYLIACGACVNTHDNELLNRGFFCLDSTRNAKPTDKPLKYLLSRGGSLKNKGFWGNNLFMSCAAGVDNAQGIQFLLNRGMDPDERIEARYLPICKNKAGLEGFCVMWMAVSNRNVRALDALIQGGANINTIYNGKSLLDIALQKGNVAQTQKEMTYEKELARLLKIAQDRPICHESVATLLKLAGAKTASELSASSQDNKE